MLRIGITIVSMNRTDTLRQTIEVARRIDPDLVIIDNGSDVDTRNYLDSCGCRWYTNDLDQKLSTAVNYGLKLRAFEQPDVLMHLDDDALLEDIGLSRDLLDVFFGNNPELGMAIPNIGNYPEYIQHEGYREIRWGLGFCWAIRTSLYQQIGGYDPQLIHQQECDLSLRVRMAGFTVGAIPGFTAIHNAPSGDRSALSLAREHLGCVQFRDKWTSYFRGADWNYGTMPLYLMQHWPPDQEWFRRYAEANGVILNPSPPDGISLPPGSVLGITPGEKFSPRHVEIGGRQYLAYADLRNDYGYWASGIGYLEDRERAINRWQELTGEVYSGYIWPKAVIRHLGCE